MQKCRNYTKIAICQMVRWFPSYHGRAKGIKLPLLLSHSRRFETQEIQHTRGAHFLPWSPILQPKYHS